jgi:hypothetical protein
MSTDAPTITQPAKHVATPSRRDRRAYYALVRSKTKHTGPELAPWGQTKLCIPNPRPGQVVDHIGADGKPVKPVMRSCIFGGNVDGTQLQRAQARRGNERLLPA